MAASRYFTRESFDFLLELQTNNHRDWFEANKDRYVEQVRDPFLRLIGDLAPALKKLKPPLLADPKPNGGSMMRIYRDTRFSKDKSPYKTFVAAHFGHANADDAAAPAAYLRIEADHSMVGGGIWQPETATLKRIRDAIVADSKSWERATSGVKLGRTCQFAGESLKRPPAGYDPSHPHIEDLRRRDFAVGMALQNAEVCGPDLKEIVLERIGATAPFLLFLSRAAGAVAPAKSA